MVIASLCISYYNFKIIVIWLFKSAYRENYAYPTDKNKWTRKWDAVKFYHRH